MARQPSVTVLAWNPRDRVVTPEELRALPTPEPLGPKHMPVHHFDYYETQESVASELGFKLTQTQIVLNGDGTRMFGGAIVVPQARGLGAALRRIQSDDAGFALVWKSGNDGRLSITLAGGMCPFICSNLDLKADSIVLKRKHTTGLRLDAELREGFERYVEGLVEFADVKAEAAQQRLTDEQAKLAIFDAFNDGMLSPRWFPYVARNYFAPEQAAILRETEGDDSLALARLVKDCGGEDPSAWADCMPRNRVGLHASFTRAIRTMPTEAKIRASQRVSRVLIPGDPRLN